MENNITHRRSTKTPVHIFISNPHRYPAEIRPGLAETARKSLPSAADSPKFCVVRASRGKGEETRKLLAKGPSRVREKLLAVDWTAVAPESARMKQERRRNKIRALLSIATRLDRAGGEDSDDATTTVIEARSPSIGHSAEQVRSIKQELLRIQQLVSNRRPDVNVRPGGGIRLLLKRAKENALDRMQTQRTRLWNVLAKAIFERKASAPRGRRLQSKERGDSFHLAQREGLKFLPRIAADPYEDEDRHVRPTTEIRRSPGRCCVGLRSRQNRKSANKTCENRGDF